MVAEFVLPIGETPKRLENYLKKQFPIGYVKKLFRRNGIRLNGRHPRPDDLVKAGDSIRIYFPFRADVPRLPAPGSAPITVVFEDDMLVVVIKPPGIAVHEAKNISKQRSLIGILEAKYRPQGIVPELVHRLDKDTSGLLLVAKRASVAATLKRCFESGNVSKEYLCLVAGRLDRPEGMIDSPLPGREGYPVRARTHFKVEKIFSTTTLLRARIDTGRLHQIRLHFAKQNHPVVMDAQHGNFNFNRHFRKAYGLKRQFLHASMVSLEYRGKKRCWTADLPDDLARTLKLLEAATKQFKIE